MTKTVLKLYAAAAVAGMGAVFAADPPPSAAAAPTGAAIKDCTGLAPAARKECQKVATQMDQASQGKPTPPRADTAPGAMHHSSPVMQTPEEKAASKAVAKGQDPKKAIEKLHAKDRPKQGLTKEAAQKEGLPKQGTVKEASPN